MKASALLWSIQFASRNSDAEESYDKLTYSDDIVRRHQQFVGQSINYICYDHHCVRASSTCKIVETRRSIKSPVMYEQPLNVHSAINCVSSCLDSSPEKQPSGRKWLMEIVNREDICQNTDFVEVNVYLLENKQSKAGFRARFTVGVFSTDGICQYLGASSENVLMYPVCYTNSILRTSSKQCIGIGCRESRSSDEEIEFARQTLHIDSVEFVGNCKQAFGFHELLSKNDLQSLNRTNNGSLLMIATIEYIDDYDCNKNEETPSIQHPLCDIDTHSVFRTLKQLKQLKRQLRNQKEKKVKYYTGYIDSFKLEIVERRVCCLLTKYVRNERNNVTKSKLSNIMLKKIIHHTRWFYRNRFWSSSQLLITMMSIPQFYRHSTGDC